MCVSQKVRYEMNELCFMKRESKFDAKTSSKLNHLALVVDGKWHYAWWPCPKISPICNFAQLMLLLIPNTSYPLSILCQCAI